MRAADDFAAIRARMKELEQARNPEPPRERDDTTWVERRLELLRRTQEQTREFRRV